MKGILFAGALLIWMPGLAFAQSFDAGDVGTILRLGKEVVGSQQLRQAPPLQQAAPRHAPATTAMSPPTPAYGAADVQHVQQRLTDLGYSPGPVDGMMGGKTAAAIRQFQHDRHLPPTGRINGHLLAVLGLQGTGASAQAVAQPSFDCARAGNATEATICAVSELAVLDRQLADAYRKARASSGNEIGQQQRQWIDQRNRCLNNAACIADAMRSRIAALGGSAHAPSTGLTFSPVQSGEVLEGKEAYDYLLAQYVRRHPDLTENEAFVAQFAGWKCSERDFYRKSYLNPFEIQDAMSDASQRLKALAASPSPDPAPLVAFELKLTLEDYDLNAGVFPIASSAQAVQTVVSAGDFCNTVARARNVYSVAGFPRQFTAKGIDGQPLGNKSIQAMIGDLAMSKQKARHLYDKGFPTIYAKVVGKVTDIARPGTSIESAVTLVPQEIRLRTRGNEKYSERLAVLGPSDLNLPTAPAPAETVARQDSVKTVWLQPSDIQMAYLKEHPELLNDPKIAADLAYWDVDRGCTEEATAASNQFEEHRLLTAAPDLARSRLQEFKAPKTLHAVVTGVLSKYDMAAGGFRMGNLNRDPAHPDQASMQINQPDSTTIWNCVTNNWPIPVDATNVVFTDQGKAGFLPLDPAVAESLVTSGITTVRIEIDAVNTGFAENGGYGDQPALTAQVTHVAFRNEKTNALLYETDVVAPPPTAWDTARKTSAANLLIHQLRQKPSLANNPGFATTYMAAAHCQEMNHARENPIRFAQVKKEAAKELADKLTEPAPKSSLFLLNFDREELGEYDIDKERFPFTPHGEYKSFFNKSYVEGVSNVCEPKGSNGLPARYKLNLTGADGLIAAGMPMDIDSAETLIDGFTNGERRVRIEVLAEVSGFRTTPVDKNHQAMPANARVVAMRVIDPKDGSVIYETSDPNVLASADAVLQAASDAAQSEAQAEPAPDLKASATEKAEAPGTDARQLSVIGIKLGMPLNNALAKVGEKSEIIYRADVEPKELERVQDRYSLVALDSGETIALHFADESGKPVIGIARSIPVQDNVPVAAIRKAFVDAYGEPTFSNGAQDIGGSDITWRWEPSDNVNSEGVECADLFEVFGAGVRGKVVHEKKNIEALQATFDDSGQAASYDDGYFFRFYTRDRWPRVALSRQSDRGNCRPFLNSIVRSINDRTFVWVHLVDLAAFQKELSKVRSMKKPGTFDADLLR